VDNDGDGFADFHGIDFDFDGIHEIPPDPACAARLATTEVAECQDLIDNDGDGFIDLADPACLTPNSLSEAVFVPFCGDGITTAPETCDDGGIVVGDGCYSNCQIEASTAIFGIAEGGSVNVTISGVVVVVATIFGDTAPQVVANLAAAVNADTALQALGFSAVAVGGSLFTDGTVDSLAIMDVGLAATPPFPVPALSPVGWLALIFCLAGCGALVPRRRRRELL
jgi:cysteine-rich repeat protein